MRQLAVLAALVAFAGGIAVGISARPGAAVSARQSDECIEWLTDTSERINIARQVLYPPERPGSAGGDPIQAAQALDQVAQEQAGSTYPDVAVELNGDLVEGFTAGAAGLAGAGPQAPETLITFAKAIVYNADARLIATSQEC